MYSTVLSYIKLYERRICFFVETSFLYPYPLGSMYGIFTYM